VAPLAIGLASLMRDFPPRREFAGRVLALTMVCVVCALLCSCPKTVGLRKWQSARFGPVAALIGSRLRPAFTPHSQRSSVRSRLSGPQSSQSAFSGDAHLSVEQRVIGAQATILGTSLGALVVAALFSERRLHESTILERGSPIATGASGRQRYSVRLELVCRRSKVQPKCD